jgi:hypothetical protein
MYQVQDPTGSCRKIERYLNEVNPFATVDRKKIERGDQKMPFNQLNKDFNQERLSSIDINDDHNFNEYSFNDKMKIDCICPKCDQKHKMSMHWIGRGTPRKYCPACKGRH